MDQSSQSLASQSPDKARTRVRIPNVALADYGLRQAARVAWYMGQSAAMHRAPSVKGTLGDKMPTKLPLPPRGRVMKDLRQLFATELDNVASGYYPMPHDNDGSLPQQLGRMRKFFADLPEANQRRLDQRYDEVKTDETLAEGIQGMRPDYYLQNFHFQTGGWLSEDSARIYDNQVEILFKGTANVMRRQALVPLARFIQGKDQRKLHMVDIACGTGKFLGAAAKAFPRLNMTGVDLSETYLGEAAKHLARRTRAGFVLANGEHLPFADNSVDVVSSIFLFHELPPKVRKIVAREIARVLKPGGIYIHLDSLQMGDTPAYDGLLDAFPHYFHEPYHASYVREDLGKLFGSAGLEMRKETPVFVSKLSVFG